MGCWQIKVREVWESNLEEELKLLGQCLHQFRLASFDTEFPGTIFTTDTPFSKLSPSEHYSLMQRNVNALKLIQLGLTLSDTHGNLPTLGTQFQYVWQFNFHGFDPDSDRHNTESVSLLKHQGIDFVKNRLLGINPRAFARKFYEYGLGRGSGLAWITFHGLYDYGYLIRILTGTRLPYSYDEFRMLQHSIFGLATYDARDMAKLLGLYGGLEKIAKRLNIDRAAGKTHQAGSDSLMTMHVFLRLTMFVPPPVLVVRAIPFCNLS